MQKLKFLAKWIAKRFHYHLIDTTAILTSTNPTLSFVETFAYGMSDETSINARLNIAKISYLGLALLYSGGRDISRKIFNITKERLRIHDAIYSMGFSSIICPILYGSSGAKDWKEIAAGTIGGIALAFPNGIVAGYSIDVARDLTGLEESNRTPEFFKRQRKEVKKSIAAGLVVGSLGLMSLIYSIAPDKKENSYWDSKVKNSIELNQRNRESCLEKELFK